MIVVDVDSASLARLRFSPSPAHELISWLRLVAHRRRHPAYGDPGAAARSTLHDRDVVLVAAVLPAAGYVPDLLTPKPSSGASDTFGDQLDRIAETAAEVVMSQLEVHRVGAPLPAQVRAAAEMGELAQRAARGMRTFWQVALEDGWARVQATLEHDIEDRARRLVHAGIGSILGAMHPTLRWDGRRAVIDKPYDEHLALEDSDLVLAPTALGWPALAVQVIDANDTVIYYPADGIGVLGGPAAPPRLATAELIGSSRDQLLSHLAEPRSTTELSTRTGLAPATISHHLSVLLRSGLLIRTRAGRHVLYHRNSRADSLVTHS